MGNKAADMVLEQFGDKALKRLKEKGSMIMDLARPMGYKPLKKYKTNLEDGKITYGEGYPIIGFEKFLGYWDKELNLAFSPSISMATDFSIARCFCRYVRAPGRDSVYLDGESEERYSRRAKKALDAFRSITGIRGSFQFTIERVKRYGNAKGLGESAAVASATSRAIVANAFGDSAAADSQFVSRFARLVSGSGTRSAAGGLSLWLSFPNISEDQSYGIRLPFDTNKLHFAAFPDSHNIQTMDAHRTASSSPFYPSWVENKYDRILRLLTSGLKARDLLSNAQSDMFLMRSILMSGGTVIDTGRSIKLSTDMLEFQRNGGDVFMTADTGPSIVVMSENRKELDRFIVEQDRKPLYGKVPKSVSFSTNSASKEKAESFFNSIK